MPKEPQVSAERIIDHLRDQISMQALEIAVLKSTIDSLREATTS